MYLLARIKKNWGILTILFVWIIILFFVSPIFEFPLNDDWVNASAVKAFIDKGELVSDPFLSPTLTLQVLWGGLFVKLFGFSFSALRISTIVLSFVCIIIVYFILKEFDFGETECVLGSLVLLLNPVYFHLTYSFMTDVPYLAFFSLAIFFFLKALKYDSLKFLIAGEIATVFSFMIRQNGILLYLGMLTCLIIMIVKRKEHKILKGIKFWVILFLPLIFMIIYFLWRYQDIFFFSPITNKFPGRDFIVNILKSFFIILPYLGLFFSPLLIGYVCNLNNIKYNKVYLKVIPFLLILFIINFVNIKLQLLMPYLKSIISAEGIGCTINIQGIKDPMFSLDWIIFFTFISSFFVSIFLGILISNISKKTEDKKRTFFLFLIYSVGLINFISIIILKSDKLYDRYFLPLILPGIVLIFDFYRGQKLSKVITIFFLIIMGVFSVKGMKDCISWNDVRWQAGNFLLSRKIPVDQIDGGYEWNGWFLYNIRNKNLRDLWQSKQYRYGKNLYPIGRKYVISFSPLKNYKTFKKIKYRACLGKREQFIYILEKLK